ncbi:MAG: redoxin domain-containing protein, partial [Proteobacteria bacterium]|nr:redoxin domain-containing protein [Pseudomonadota bacterium]
YSRLDRSAARIENGKPLPEFSALNLDGKPVYSRDLLGKPALLMFYRGNWCPFCVVQVKELAAAYRELGDRARIVLISPQPARKTRELAARFDVPFDFWVDTDNQAATVLGINHDQGLPAGMQVLGYDTDTVLPTSVVLAADGTVLNVDETENYRDRAEPGFLAKVLERHGL